MKSDQTKIEWAHYTFNPWRGCTKVSEGCAHCYAEVLSRRNPATLGTWGPGKPRVLAADEMWKSPLKWNATQHWLCRSCGAVPTGPGVDVARRALATQIDAINRHFADGKDPA